MTDQTSKTNTDRLPAVLSAMPPTLTVTAPLWLWGTLIDTHEQVINQSNDFRQFLIGMEILRDASAVIAESAPQFTNTPPEEGQPGNEDGTGYANKEITISIRRDLLAALHSSAVKALILAHREGLPYAKQGPSRPAPQPVTKADMEAVASATTQDATFDMIWWVVQRFGAAFSPEMIALAEEMSGLNLRVTR